MEQEHSFDDIDSRRSDKGFTLVELLIVIVILGILATVTVFAVRGITDQGKTNACESDQKVLETAVETYFAKNGGSALPTHDSGDTDTVATVEEAFVRDGFIRDVSDMFNVNTAGNLTAVTGSGCTV